MSYVSLTHTTRLHIKLTLRKSIPPSAVSSNMYEYTTPINVQQKTKYPGKSLHAPSPGAFPACLDFKVIKTKEEAVCLVLNS